MSNITNDANQIFQDNSRTLAPASVGSQVALMSIVSVVTILLFNVLRPKNKVIYEPKVKYHVGDKPPPKISDSLCGWLPPILHTKEPELLDKIGLDAVIFLRFLRLLRWLFSGVALLTCATLIPITIVFNLRNVKSGGRDILSMLTVRDVNGSFLYAHIVVTYLITIFVAVIVDIHWRQVVRLRHTWFRSPEYMQSFYARTLQVTHVPKKFQTDEGLRAVFDTVKVPYPTTSVHIGRKVGKLPEMIEYHNQTVREFEEVLVKYLRNGTVGPKRPTIRVGGCCGCGGVKKDAIDFYTAKLKRTEASIEEYRAQIDTRKAENYGFASMAAVAYAHIVAKILSGKHPKGTDIALAPNPKDIIWANMNKTDAELARKKLLGFLWLFVVCFFNTVPLFAISILANLNSLRSYVPFLQTWFDASEFSFAFVSGVLPPAISGFFGFFLPIIMRWLTQYMGALTHSKLDRAVIARYFAFLVISQLVIFTLLGVIFNVVEVIVIQIGRKASFQEIVDKLRTLPDTINSTYINQSSYWLTFFPLRGFLVVFDLAQIINLVWIFIKTRLFGRTPRDIREWTKPPNFEYAVYYSNILFMAAVGLVFAPLAPLVVLAAAIVFWMSSWVYKYQLMFVFVSKVESGGRIWNVVINRLLACVVLMQLLMVLTIGLAYGFSSFRWVAMIPPIFIIIAFKIYLNTRYLPAFRHFIPTQEEINVAKVHSERGDAQGNRLEKRFGHPALIAELFTPMLHAKMMSLLPQVYQGKISNDQAKLDEYGGQKMAAQIVPGGIKIAAIDQSQLEYDPALYRRDRGELDWDQKSISSNTLFDGQSTLAAAKSQYYANGAPARPHGYDQYLVQGPTNSDAGHIELKRMDSMQEPLLSPTSDYYNQQSVFAASQQSLAPSYQNADAYVSREAPTHRPQQRSYSPSPTYSSDAHYRQNPAQTSTASPYAHAQNPSQQYFQQYTESQSQDRIPQYHGRQSSANLLSGRGTSPAPPSAFNYSPTSSQQHIRQGSGNLLAGQGPSSSPSPSPDPYTHRQSPSQQYAQQPSSRQGNNTNMAGRGAFRG